jgi:hypothetical protein
MNSRARLTFVAAAAISGVGELLRRRQSARLPVPPPVTTQSSPGQIADLQQAYGADMAAASVPAPGEGTVAG